LLDHGHPNALSYPVWLVFVEADFVVRRINAHLAIQTSLLQMALSSIPNMSVKPAGTKKTATDLSEILKGMIDGR